MQEGKLHAQIDELSMQLEAKEEAHRLAMEEKLAAIASLNGVIKVRWLHASIIPAQMAALMRLGATRAHAFVPIVAPGFA